MTFPNHVLGGVVVTGVFASILDVNIIESPALLGACVLGSVLPDIDHPRSPIGFMFYPLSRFLNRRFGHRTITHSLFFFLLLILISVAFESAVFGSKAHTLVFGIGYASHLLLDMMTVQGVPLYYPIWKNACVVPGRAEMRFRTGKPKSEVMIFGFFTISLLMLQPLMDKGFWTSYNQAFGTPKHLAAEFKRSSDVLFVDFELKEGTDIITRSGFVVEASEHQFVVINDHSDFLSKIDAKQVVSVSPQHIDKKLKIERISFAMISEDSLNLILNNQHIRNITLASSKSFTTSLDSYLSQKKQVSLDYISHLQVRMSENDFVAKEFIRFVNPSIRKLRSRLKFMQDKNSEAGQEQEMIGLRIIEIGEELKGADFSDRQFLLEELEDLEVRVKHVDRSKEVELEMEISYLLESDRLKNGESLQDVKLYNSLKPKDQFFSGSMELIKIEDEEFEFPTSLSTTDQIWDML